ncbi:MAG TPA: VCBS repeat-containing protein, partial [Capsulimonadaceae bacterium]|nr:VCBS repeat-containing protein [Capsulimonadaceae bacterium]
MISYRTWLILPLAAVAALLLASCRANIPGSPGGSSEAASGQAARFVDIAARSGITYRWQLPEKRPLNILQTIGNGCAFLDYNNDGNLDILFVGGKLALYQGDGHGHFTDVTHQTGLDKLHGDFRGCAVGDYDNDGYDDIYVTAYRGGALLHNERGVSFKDVTKAAGIAPQPWGSSASFADVDGDGKLDLYIGDYVQFGPGQGPELCLAPGNHRSVCHPYYYKPLKGVLYHNLGSGKFQDVTEAWGAQAVHGNTLAVAFADYLGKGHPALALANDELPGDLLQYQNGKMSNIAAAAGVAYNRDGSTHAGMGVDWGDYNNDGKLDLVVTTFEVETKPIYRQEAAGLFNDQATALGFGEATLPYLSFGVKWLDYDNDGWLDLIVASGHVADNVADYMPDHSFLQPTLLFHNDHAQHFTDVSHAAGPDLSRPIL